MSEILDDCIAACEKFSKMVVAMEIRCSPADKQTMLDLCEEAAPKDSTLGFTGIPIVADPDIRSTHWLAVMSDHSIDIFGATAVHAAIRLIDNNPQLRIGKVKL